MDENFASVFLVHPSLGGPHEFIRHHTTSPPLQPLTPALLPTNQPTVQRSPVRPGAAKKPSQIANQPNPTTQGFVQVYKHILETGASPSGAQPFAAILRHLASPPGPHGPSPLLVHCTAGKDRTGVAVALVLSLCGVPDAAVAHDYGLTDLGLRERREEFVAHLVQSPPLLGDRPAALRMTQSRRQSMLDTLAMLRDRWGGAEAFVRHECGLSAAEVDAVRANMVVDVGEEHVPLDWEEHAKLMA